MTQLNYQKLSDYQYTHKEPIHYKNRGGSAIDKIELLKKEAKEKVEKKKVKRFRKTKKKNTQSIFDCKS